MEDAPTSFFGWFGMGMGIFIFFLILRILIQPFVWILRQGGSKTTERAHNE